MPGPDQLERLGRALTPVIGVLLAIAVVGVVNHDGPETGSSGAAGPVVPGTSEPSPDDDAEATTTAPPETGTATTLPSREDGSTTTSTTAPLGRAVVPAPGTYRYEIDSIRDGETASRVETREISALGEVEGGTAVQVVAASEGERQVSVFDWSPNGAIVRSTRIETDGETSQECLWEPPFIEFGALEPDAKWSVDSRCATEVAGLVTEFAVTGGGGVVGEVEVAHAGARVRAWQVDRSRTTVITARIGDDEVEQRVEETGTFFIDPARGLVVRSDVTVVLSGSQQGETRRTSVLAE